MPKLWDKKSKDLGGVKRIKDNDDRLLVEEEVRDNWKN